MEDDKLETSNKIKYKVINPGTDIDGAIYTEEEICIAAGINPKACGAVQLAMASFWDVRFERINNQPPDSGGKKPQQGEY